MAQTPDDSAVALGKFIRKKRKERGWTLKDVAQAVGVSEGTVSRWENGLIKNMRGSHFALLSQELNIPLSAFLIEDPSAVEAGKELITNSQLARQNRQKERQSLKQLCYDLHEQGNSYMSIAQKLGIAWTTARRYDQQIKADKLAKEDQPIKKVDKTNHRRSYKSKQKPSAAASELDKVNSEPIQTDGKTIAIHQLINREHKEPVEEFDLNEIKKAGSVKARRARKARQAKERKEKQKQDELRNAILLSTVQSTFSKK